MQGMAIILLAPAAILFLIALLALVRAPTYLLWKLAIGATEWGHAFALICFGVAALLWNGSLSGSLALGLCLMAGILALTPVMRAKRVARELPIHFEKA